jgi:hypothetical protein
MASGDKGDSESNDPGLFCPSARADMRQAVVFGVVDGSPNDPRVSYLASPLPVTPELLALAEPARPAEVFRIGAPCAQHRCQHYDGSRCGLIQQIVAEVPAVASRQPPCRLRPRCRWWHEEGIAACTRCPLVVTEQPNPSREMARAAVPGSAGRARG